MLSLGRGYSLRYRIEGNLERMHEENNEFAFVALKIYAAFNPAQEPSSLLFIIMLF